MAPTRTDTEDKTTAVPVVSAPVIAKKVPEQKPPSKIPVPIPNSSGQSTEVTNETIPKKPDDDDEEKKAGQGFLNIPLPCLSGPIFVGLYSGPKKNKKRRSFRKKSEHGKKGLWRVDYRE